MPKWPLFGFFSTFYLFISAEQPAETQTANPAVVLVSVVDRIVLPRVKEVCAPRHRGEERPRLVRGLRQVGRFRSFEVP